MAASGTQSELRLVVLGPIKPGNRTAVCSILGLEESQRDAEAQECTKHRGEAAGRQVVVVSSPAWYASACSPDERRTHISSLIASSSPGPHAFLLCVPVNEPARDESMALDALAKLFGPAAVSQHTVILFTHTEELGEDETLEQYVVTWRKDLRQLVERCGDRYHTLESGGGGAAEEGRAVEELLEKVEQAVKESGGNHLSCPLYREAEDRVRQLQTEIIRQRSANSSASDSQQEVTEQEMEAVREEAERSTGDFDLNLDDIFPSDDKSVSPSSAPPSLLRGLWEKLVGWVRWLPSLVRVEALFGALVGLFVGGTMGGTVGATVGSVATEVSRRKTEKTK
ncbi:PREDICTED: GTPase IMAP family member 1-like isoform X1 [Poecilia mexicana]|uniref:AIG1-type G domain-containing protein n=1 Tax=Poecilia mexicana TaxID=48701 RepID=A0A3B3WIZ0_9TELE|nr:PREDICTED: GTPase IMAP family member 1-like isoform X1 [Poecilia mexicana]